LLAVYGLFQKKSNISYFLSLIFILASSIVINKEEQKQKTSRGCFFDFILVNLKNRKNGGISYGQRKDEDFFRKQQQEIGW
jgi:hypothetical protein